MSNPQDIDPRDIAREWDSGCPHGDEAAYLSAEERRVIFFDAYRRREPWHTDLWQVGVGLVLVLSAAVAVAYFW